jgi:hypothetical protein
MLKQHTSIVTLKSALVAATLPTSSLVHFSHRSARDRRVQNNILDRIARRAQAQHRLAEHVCGKAGTLQEVFALVML